MEERREEEGMSFYMEEGREEGKKEELWWIGLACGDGNHNINLSA